MRIASKDDIDHGGGALGTLNLRMIFLWTSAAASDAIGGGLAGGGVSTEVAGAAGGWRMIFLKVGGTGCEGGGTGGGGREEEGMIGAAGCGGSGG